ncbi:hypothetical protein F8566_19280 [Actinomadura rudentiformis]|uniref:Uncharacterized protein n=1 Tax=Actinomadura rudentiformis TaxID=359158 RepID=A0A6H9YUE7_9ACTN|nr:hypothetical protein F8566_19280 [Actinomadura rudentiformis]
MDVSPWLRPDANTSPGQPFCHTHGRSQTQLESTLSNGRLRPPLRERGCGRATSASASAESWAMNFLASVLVSRDCNLIGSMAPARSTPGVVATQRW